MTPVKVVFEAGATHTGIDSAKRLAAMAAKAGADAVKFQMTDPDRLLHDPYLPFTYKDSNGTEHTEPIRDILVRRMLTRQEWVQLKNHCDEHKIEFFCTADFTDDVDFLTELGCSAVKISSGDINYFDLIRHAGRSGMQVQIDTGSASLGEVEQAVDELLDSGCSDILIHHCPSGYPAEITRVNLRVIQTLQAMFPFPIGYSDHSFGINMNIAAIALGATLVEKTITENRCARGPEHAFSLDIDLVDAFVRCIRDMEQALGAPRKILTPADRYSRKAIRRSNYDGEWRRPER